MVKIGRNEPCPCGSGLKYKKCCLPRGKRSPASIEVAAPAPQAFVNGEIVKLCERAAVRQPSCRQIGALIFFSTTAGHAWLLELTEQDAVQVARSGEPLTVTINETAETFEIGWTHRFALKGELLTTTAYLGNNVASHQDCPVGEIRAAMEHLRRQYSQRDLEKIRIQEP